MKSNGMFSPEACLKIHSRQPLAPLRSIFVSNLVGAARCASFLRAKYTAK